MKCAKSSKLKNLPSSSGSLGTVPGCRSANSATSAKRDRADVVDVQLSLGETGDEALSDRHGRQSLTISRPRGTLALYMACGPAQGLG